MSVLNPWVSEDLTPRDKKTSLVDDVTEIIHILWEADENDFRQLLTSTDKEDVVDKSLRWDKDRAAMLVWLYAKQDGFSRVASADLGDVDAVMHWAAKRYGKDRKSIATAKADYKALHTGNEASDSADSGQPAE